jgi:muramoyltetrapeptide carboxypeptidase
VHRRDRCVKPGRVQTSTRLGLCMDFLRNRGFDVVVGSRLDNSGYVRAPALDRAAELTSMPVDPTVRPVIPPWAVIAIDLLPRPHWAQIPAGTPT